MQDKSKMLPACLYLLLLLPAPFAAAQSPEAGTDGPLPQTAAATTMPPVQGSSVPQAEEARGLLQTAALPTAGVAGICPVVADLLKDYCAQYPADAACKAP